MCWLRTAPSPALPSGRRGIVAKIRAAPMYVMKARRKRPVQPLGWRRRPVIGPPSLAGRAHARSLAVGSRRGSGRRASCGSHAGRPKFRCRGRGVSRAVRDALTTRERPRGTGCRRVRPSAHPRLRTDGRDGDSRALGRDSCAVTSAGTRDRLEDVSASGEVERRANRRRPGLDALAEQTTTVRVKRDTREPSLSARVAGFHAPGSCCRGRSTTASHARSRPDRCRTVGAQRAGPPSSWHARGLAFIPNAVGGSG
jgi:hypothetical protein